MCARVKADGDGRNVAREPKWDRPMKLDDDAAERLAHQQLVDLVGANVLRVVNHDIADVLVEAPPLVTNLVGRAATTRTPSAQFAKLCIPIVLAHVFLKGDVFITDFEGAALTDPQVHDLAAKIRVERNAAVQDENAMVPLIVHVRLHNGRQHSQRLDAVLGSPAKPLSRTEHLHKFRRCWQHGGRHLPAGHDDRLIDMVEYLEDVPDVAELCRLLVPSPSPSGRG